jgi:hypothetical protein
MNSIDDILSGTPTTLGERATADKLDQLIDSSNDPQERFRNWNRVAAELETKGVSSNHAHFRLGIRSTILTRLWAFHTWNVPTNRTNCTK